MEKFGSEYHKKYYLENKDRYKQYWAVKVECPICKSVYVKSNATNHLKTKKHLNAISLLHQKDDTQMKQKYAALKKKYLELIEIM